MTIWTLLLIILILALIGAFPRWKYNSEWGYGPMSLVGIVLVIVLLVMLLGDGGSIRIPSLR